MEIKVDAKQEPLSSLQRQEYIKMCDTAVADLSYCLEELHRVEKTYLDEKLLEIKKINQIFNDASLFVISIEMDLLIYSKYLIQTKSIVEKQFFRGKLRVLLNEGFKKLYGFCPDNYKKSEWSKIQSLVEMFPGYKLQIDSITSELDNYSKMYEWWQRDRNYEVHLDISGLYESRHSILNENQVVMESLELWGFFKKYMF